MGFRRPQASRNPRIQAIRGVLWSVLGLNILVAAAKLGYGLATRSIAMEADGFHSFFDGTSNVVGLLGIAAASHVADRRHPYGYGKYEAYASAAIGALLLGAAWKVGSDALNRFLDGTGAPRVDTISFLIMAVTLGVNLAVTIYERKMGRRLNSDLLLADASHTGSDIFVSLGVMGGLAAVRLGYPLMDPLIALSVAGFIVWTAWGVFRRVNTILLDQPRIPIADIAEVAFGIDGVLGCHSVRTRGASAEVCVDLHIQVAPTITVVAGHRIAEQVERAICAAFREVVDVIVHLEPLDSYQADKTEAERSLAP